MANDVNFQTPTIIHPSLYRWSWPRSLYFLLAVLVCLLLNLAIQYGDGYYNYVSFTFLTISVILSVLLIPALFSIEAAVTRSNFSTNTMLLFTTILLILELYLGSQDAYLHYNQNPLFPGFAKGITWTVILLTTTYLIPYRILSVIPTVERLMFNIQGNLIKYRFLFIGLLMTILKIVAVFASPTHHIDVGVMMQESSSHFLTWQNPYNTPTSWLGGFIYLPLNLLLPLPFYAILGDTRFGSIFWELIGVFLVHRLAKTELASLPKLVNLSELVILLFFLQPRGLFVIEQSWSEPLLVGMIAISFYFLYYQPIDPLTDILLGLMLTIKQYSVFMGFALFIFYQPTWKRYLITGLTCLTVLLPFILWNPQAFYQHTILHYIQLPIQTNSLGLTAYFWERSLFIPRWIGPMAAVVTTFGLGLLLRRFGILGYLHTSILTLLILFLLGQQAFANYYYLISFLQTLAIIFFILFQFAPSNRLAIIFPRNRL